LWSNDGLCDIRKGWRLSLLVIENWGWTYHRRTSTLKSRGIKSNGG
jgi:hypothetical protein